MIWLSQEHIAEYQQENKVLGVGVKGKSCSMRCHIHKQVLRSGSYEAVGKENGQW